MEAADAQRLKALEAENGRLKKLLAEAHLDIEALKIGFGLNTSPATQTRGNRRLLEQHGIRPRPLLIQPGKPMQNGYIESFKASYATNA